MIYFDIYFLKNKEWWDLRKQSLNQKINWKFLQNATMLFSNLLSTQHNNIVQKKIE